MTKEEVVDLMKSSKNTQEWNSNCDTVKTAHDGQYPDYWFTTMIMSGLCDEILGKGASDITIKVG
jgi:hypothetical protein